MIGQSREFIENHLIKSNKEIMLFCQIVCFRFMMPTCPLWLSWCQIVRWQIVLAFIKKMRCHRKGIFLSTHSLTGLSTLDHYAWPPWQIWFTATYPQDPLQNVLGGLIAQYTITQYDNSSTIYHISSLLDLTDGKDFVAMEWSIVLERHPLDLMEWRWFSIV